jgi:hypothetical protein
MSNAVEGELAALARWLHLDYAASKKGGRDV